MLGLKNHSAGTKTASPTNKRRALFVFSGTCAIPLTHLKMLERNTAGRRAADLQILCIDHWISTHDRTVYFRAIYLTANTSKLL